MGEISCTVLYAECQMEVIPFEGFYINGEAELLQTLAEYDSLRKRITRDSGGEKVMEVNHITGHPTWDVLKTPALDRS